MTIRSSAAYASNQAQGAYELLAQLRELLGKDSEHWGIVTRAMCLTDDVIRQLDTDPDWNPTAVIAAIQEQNQ